MFKVGREKNLKIENNNTNKNWLFSEKWKQEITFKCWNKKLTLNSIARETVLEKEM